jgi:hypothetical protein
MANSVLLLQKENRGSIVRSTSSPSQFCVPSVDATVLTTPIRSIDGLLQLHNKAKVMNTYFDDRTELSTVRRAWREVVEHCDRGTSCFSCSRLRVFLCAYA